jgi:hypothetical protein
MTRIFLTGKRSRLDFRHEFRGSFAGIASVRFERAAIATTFPLH